MKRLEKCKVDGPCFARQGEMCTILISTPEISCSFQKRYRGITKGKRYPYNPNIGMMRFPETEDE